MQHNHFTQLTRGVIRVGGADAAKFLQGLTTNQMKRVEAGGDSLFAAFLSAPGRVLADGFVHPTNANNGANSLLIDVDARVTAPLLKHLKKYALRAKVEIDDASAAFIVNQAWGPQAAALWAGHYVKGQLGSLPAGTVLAKDRFVDIGCKDPRHPDLGLRYVLPAESKVDLPSTFTETSELEYKIHRLLNGIPEGVDDIFTNVSLPLESNFDLMSGVDFRKGCYLGQELTIRTYHIGVTRKRIVPVQIYREADELSTMVPTKLTLDRTFSETLPPSMTEIRALNKADGIFGKREVGKFCSGVHNIGLALVRLEHAGFSPETDLVLSPDASARGLRVRAFPPNWLFMTIAYFNWNPTADSSFALLKKAIESHHNLKGLELLHVTQNAIPTDLDTSKVEVVILGSPLAGIWSQFVNLRLILVAWAGVDKLVNDATLPRHIPVVRLVDDAMTFRMGQSALAHVLNHHRHLSQFVVQQRKTEWKKTVPKPISEYTIGILGAGVLGKEIATQLFHNGFTSLIGWGTSERSFKVRRLISNDEDDEEDKVEIVDGYVPVVAGREGLARVLESSDAVINILPSTPDTRGLIGFNELAQMKRAGSVFINLGRGATVVQEDVIKALNDATIGVEWTVLDVFEVEPLPVESPLWNHERVFVTPHVAATTDYTSAAKTLAGSLARFYSGKPLVKGVVDFSRNY
ncbi:UNVERIFIED_CONTAM: Iron-sulfur clusters incorporation protein [Siphonaria sp. JEL0065]|nr:Iron-sulfur clusters incorporation protein [Siphonaria sp. JEL0065]